MLPLIAVLLGLGTVVAVAASKKKPAAPSPIPSPTAPPVEAHLPPVTKALVQRAATTGTDPKKLIAAAQKLQPTAPLAAQALADRAKAISPAAAQASQAVKQAQAALPGAPATLPATIPVVPSMPSAPLVRPAQYLSVPTGVARMGTITGDGVAMRDTPGGSLRLRLPKGARVGFYGTEGTWTHIAYQGYDGYASSQYVQPDPATSAGFHMNEPGFYSDQTNIYPIGY